MLLTTPRLIAMVKLLAMARLLARVSAGLQWKILTMVDDDVAMAIVEKINIIV